ncbi:MAG: restriction endonuclease [Candidatus Omnitrophota bacterium]
MNNIILKSLGNSFFYTAIVVGFFSWGYIKENPERFIIPLIIVILLTPYFAILRIYNILRNENEKTLKQKEQAEKDALKRVEQAEKDSSLWKKSLLEKTSGFPSLITLIEEYERTKDVKLEMFLKTKSHPAFTSAEIVKGEAKRRRFAESESRKIKAIIEYYETIAPFLLDFKEEIAGIESEDSFRDYTEEERLDPAITYLAKEEFRKLPSVERNQMALDRFWSRPKSKWLIGRIYERYVGYLHEEMGYDVEYVGIFKGYEDLGRDLICRKGNDFIIIQCKYWSQFRTIYEKHIFQFFGTVFQYKDENPGHNTRAIFYTTTKLSDLARRFARELGIELQENCKFDQSYASIKCNISSVDKTKIYHLPFDQQYDKVKIEKNKGEFYCSTVKEAEAKGFRRAFRYKGMGLPK